MAVHLSTFPNLDGHVALVTGAAGGIGHATCTALAGAGAKVIATDVVDEHPFESTGIAYHRYDVCSSEETDALVSRLVADMGRIDILVLCAGSIARTPLADSDDAEWKRMFDVNVMGVVNPLRRVYPRMIDQGYGKVVALGSIAAKIGGVAAGPAYVASKSAVHGLMKWVAKSGAEHGVYANTIAPGPVETTMWATVTEKKAPSPSSTIPLGRYGQPEDIAQGILYLASPASNWITGTVLDINGGMLMD